jgi:hypothetical protein
MVKGVQTLLDRERQALQSIPDSVGRTASLLRNSASAAMGGPVNLVTALGESSEGMLMLKMSRWNDACREHQPLGQMYVDPAAGIAYIQSVR